MRKLDLELSQAMMKLSAKFVTPSTVIALERGQLAVANSSSGHMAQWQTS
jgi:hypothetical protein